MLNVLDPSDPLHPKLKAEKDGNVDGNETTYIQRKWNAFSK